MIGFTNMGQAWGRRMEIHYLVLALILFYPIVCVVLRQSNINLTFKRGFVILFVAYIVASDGYYFEGTEKTGIPDYVAWMEESRYQYGWSYTVWDGLELTAYTDGAVEACYVETPEYSTENTQLAKKSWASQAPEFMLIPAEEDAEAILEDCPYYYDMVYSDDEMLIYALSSK
jgi:hypothetical protein